MLDDFLIRAALAGLALSVAAAPLGCFVVWRRLAYFGEAVSHSAILGVALALALSIAPIWGALAVAAGMAVAVALLDARGLPDAILGTLSHGALAAGLVALSLSGARVDPSAFLFGDVFGVARQDLAGLWMGAALVAALLAWRWRRLLTSTLDADLARATGIDPRREGLILSLALAVAVAMAIEVVGALLTVAMLIIPATAARGLARSPEGMVVAAALIGAASVGLGLAASLAFDTPGGPSIALSAAALFALTLPLRRS
ncbi:zinc transport system permease protein [Hasllibacter halocynthiae]|uniref:High-affinity zinc uptake system membrane protein ZnuB n=1 Tax=Hasllibacter halocynthiae TaxID=595589 RepID=A0A2T0X7D6_9RHOB|nr:metal ABC transporter permease [Hasllibacter halocynthiae]PRY94837.1 zinc transport system permease protein [Hasllibacter halocynthiae]